MGYKSNKIITSTTSIRCQFHHHFTHAFFVQNSFEQLFPAKSLALKKLLYKKCTRKMLMKLTLELFDVLRLQDNLR